MVETIFQVILAAIGLGILIFVHEYGHYWVARRVGMKVEVFSIGFGKPIYSWMHQDVKWQLGWLPFGGYVRISGMELGKADNESDASKTPGGFFASRPFDRLKVAIAGPLANLLLAVVLFAIIWAFGGREKPFSEYTERIGWVDTAGPLYQDGIRPGDTIHTYNEQPYHGIKDLLYAAMFSHDPIALTGMKVNEETGEQTPYRYSVEPYSMPGISSGLKTVGVLGAGQYLLYEPDPSHQELLPAGSPMAGSGIQPGDRLIWADGDPLFSMEQLSTIINEPQALVTVQRGSNTFLARVPRIRVSELKLDTAQRAELEDWLYVSSVNGRLSQLYFIPYNLTPDGIIENRLAFIDADMEQKAFPHQPLSPWVDIPLQAGDRILAIGGKSVKRGAEILQELQERTVHLIVQRSTSYATVGSWKEEDARFDAGLQLAQIHQLATTIGTEHPVDNLGDLYLLKPVTPKTLQEFSLTEEQRATLAVELSEQRSRIEKISDSETRSRAMHLFEESQKRLMLGVTLRDLVVDYNPNPLVLFENVFVETWRTLIALVSGYLNPKWLSGPIGIVRVIQMGWETGVKEAIYWLGAISINLGFLNLLPIPVLDGGYILIALYEIVTKRRVKPQVLEKLIFPFVILLIGFFLFVTYYDVLRLF